MAGIGEFIKDFFPREYGVGNGENLKQFFSVFALIHFSVFTMVLPPGWVKNVFVFEYVRGNLSYLWLTNWRRKNLKKKGSQFIRKYFYSENCFKYHYLYLKKTYYFTCLKKRGVMKDAAVVSFCVFMGGDWKTTEWEKKFKLPETLLGVGHLKR